MSKYAQQIKELRSQGFNYTEIQKQVGCCYVTVVSHCNPEFHHRLLTRRQNQHPFIVKALSFQYASKKRPNKTQPPTQKYYKSLLTNKIADFCKRDTNMSQPTFTHEDVINKFGTNPTCYLTGESIDILQPRTYHFDHIIPASRGGKSNLDNLGICTKRANQAKSNMTPDEFVNFCKTVLEHHGYSVD